jgi:hypothetical protein
MFARCTVASHVSIERKMNKELIAALHMSWNGSSKRVSGSNVAIKESLREQ